MASSHVQFAVEAWVCSTWLKEQFGQNFDRARLLLRTGGEYSFAAVSADRKIVATICTSKAKTSSGKYADANILKLRGDMLFLTLVRANKRFIVFTEPDMLAECEKEAARGRVPPEVEFLYAPIPSNLRGELVMARAKASSEGRSVRVRLAQSK